MKMTITISRSAFARPIVESRLHGVSAYAFAAAFLLLALLASTRPGVAQTTSNPDILIADFNHDGIPDVLVPSPATSSFTLSFGIFPFGTFSPVARTVPFPANCTAIAPGTTIVADFNGDGFPDLALNCSRSTSNASNYSVAILLGHGDGTFTVKTPSLTGLNNLVAGDFNHDGKMDLVAVGDNGLIAGESIRFYAGQGDGSFARAVTAAITGTVYSAALALDLNNDGYSDLALGNFTNQGAAMVDIYGNNKDGTFGVPATLTGPSTTISAGTYPAATNTSILAGNFYGTGLADLAIVDTGANPGISVVKNTSTATVFSFAAPASIVSPGLVSATSASFTSITSDLLVYDGEKLSVLANDGAGNFAATYAALSAVGTSPLYAAADANGDGHADIYTAAIVAGGSSLTVDLVSGSASAVSAPFALPSGTAALAAAWPGNFGFSGANATGSQIVNPLATTLSLVSSKNPSSAREPVTFTASVLPTVSGNHVATGTVLFSDGTTQLGMSALGAGGTAALSIAAFAAGPHNILASYSGDAIFSPATLATPLAQQVTALVPTITWPAPAAIAYGTPLGPAQLDATASGVTGAAVAGTFVYTPAAGAVLNPGPQTLSVTFTPTDLATYATASATVQLNVIAVTLTSVTPNTAQIGDPDKTITITGSNLGTATIVQVNGAAIPSMLVNPTTLTAIIPAADFSAPGTLMITLRDPATGFISPALAFTVAAPPVGGTLTGPPVATPGSQPTLNFTIPAYPADITATLTLTQKSAISSGVTDPNVLFANGSRTFSFVVKAGTTTTPAIQLQAGTVAETITVTAVLTIGTVDVTPADLAPVVIQVPAAVPVATTTTVTRSGNQLVVTVVGFSNTREVAKAAFHFVPATGATLGTADFAPDVDGIFTTWFADPASPGFGSSFTYTQNFTVSDGASKIGSVEVTLTNTVGASVTETAQ